MSASVSESLELDHNMPTGAPQDAVVVQESGDSKLGQNLAQVAPPVVSNFFTMTRQGALGLSTSQVQILIVQRIHQPPARDRITIPSVKV